MAPLRIVTHPSPKLRKKSKKVRVFDRILEALVRDMFDTMYANNGVGLAAIQVGIPLRIFVTDDDPPNNPRVFINPELNLDDFKEDGVERDIEGCLSLPGLFGYVERNRKVKIRYQDLKGDYHEEVVEGFLARVIQHEYDHLEGILFIDRTDQVFTEEELQRMREEGFEVNELELQEGRARDSRS